MSKAATAIRLLSYSAAAFDVITTPVAINLPKIVKKFSTPLASKVEEKYAIFYRGTGPLIVSELEQVIKDGEGGVNFRNRSSSVYKLGDDIFRSKLWRGVGIVFSFKQEEFERRLCVISASDKFTGAVGEELVKEIGEHNLVIGDDNVNQQRFLPYEKENLDYKVEKFRSDYEKRLKPLHPYFTNEALLQLDMSCYSSAQLCFNPGIFLNSKIINEFLFVAEKFGEFFRDHDLSHSELFAINTEEGIAFIESKNIKDFCAELKEALPSKKIFTAPELLPSRDITKLRDGPSALLPKNKSLTKN